MVRQSHPKDSQPAQLALGIDFGTSGVRAIAVDAAGVPLAEAKASLPAPHRPDAERSEQDPETWWRGLLEVLGSLAQHVDLARIGALAVDGTSATLVPCARDGTPTGAAIMYDDQRGRPYLAAIARHAPDSAAVHSPSSSLAKAMALLAGCRPEDRPRWAQQADWISGRLTGRPFVADTHNALKFGYDAKAARWPDWLVNVGIELDSLPEVVEPGAVIGHVSRSAAAATGLRPRCIVVAGTTDSTAAALAANAPHSGVGITSLGSTLVVKVWAVEPLFAPAYGVYSHRVGTRWLAGGASNTGGAVLARFFEPARIAELCADIDPDQPSGLDYYPLLRPGERFPINDPNLAPRLTPRPADDRLFLLGLLESIAAIEYRSYRLLKRLGAEYPSRVVSLGGGANNPVWTAIRSRVLGTDVIEAEHREAAYGAARLALAALPAAGSGQTRLAPTNVAAPGTAG